MNMFNIFIALLLFHLLEHILQLIQLYILRWPPHLAGGFLGFIFPPLVHNELLHFSFALFHLIGVIHFRKYFRSKYTFSLWQFSIYFQVFHFSEHITLLGQYILGIPMGDRMTMIQILSHIPRPVLHTLYNIIATAPLFLCINRLNRFNQLRRFNTRSLLPVPKRYYQ